MRFFSCDNLTYSLSTPTQLAHLVPFYPRDADPSTYKILFWLTIFSEQVLSYHYEYANLRRFRERRCILYQHSHYCESRDRIPRRISTASRFHPDTYLEPPMDPTMHRCTTARERYSRTVNYIHIHSVSNEVLPLGRFGTFVVNMTNSHTVKGPAEKCG